MGFARRTLAALGKVGIVLAVLLAFLFGMLSTVYLSLRTSEVKVPDVLGKDRFTAEKIFEDAGLKLRVRGARASAGQPDTVLSQLPEAGLTVKTGIEVAVEVSRAPKEGERVSAAEETPAVQETEKPAENSNQGTSATNQNQNQNQNKPPKNKNTNKNANNKNANNSNNSNANTNRNANNRNANTTRNTNTRNANTTPNANRTTTPNANTIRRPPISTPPFNPGANRGTP